MIEANIGMLHSPIGSSGNCTDFGRASILLNRKPVDSNMRHLGTVYCVLSHAKLNCLSGWVIRHINDVIGIVEKPSAGNNLAFRRNLCQGNPVQKQILWIATSRRVVFAGARNTRWRRRRVVNVPT